MKILKLMMVAMVVAVGVCAYGAPKKGAGAVRKAAPAKRVQTAAKKPVAKKPAAAAKAAAPMQSAYRRLPYVGAISADAATGKILFSDNADQKAYPASVTKLMTLLLVLEDVRAGRYKLDTPVTATADVNYSEPSWIGLKAGDVISVRDLCQALMVESANDAAIALGVKSAGSFTAFVERMNARAAELGMTKTIYYNPNGLPPKAGRRYPWKAFNVSTAADQLKLARRLVAMPEALRLTSVKTCDLIKTPTGFRVSVTRRTNEPLAPSTLAAGETRVKQMNNHNNIMRTDKLKILNPDGREAVDGLKTGYIDAGGSSITLTAQRGGKRVIVVVLGSATSKDRDSNARTLVMRALDAVAGPGGTAAVDKPAAVSPSAPAPSPVSAPAASASVASAPQKAGVPPADAGKSSVDAPQAANAATESAPDKRHGSSSLGWVIIGGAVLTGGAAYAAWSWLGKTDHDEWVYEDIPTDDSKNSGV